MKITIQSVTKSLISMILVISVVFSMSSCVFSFGISDMIDGFNSEEDKKNDQNTTPYIPDHGNTESADGDNNENKPGQLYPGSGEESLENISALHGTLLSTVVIYSTSGLTPSTGSGVIYQIDKEKGDAYIITNYHVVYNKNYGISNEIEVYLYGMMLSSYAIPATFIGGSVTYDIAVLRISNNEILKQSYAKAAELTSSENVKVFDTVFAVGNPEGSGISATKGIVSVQSENLDIEGADGSEISLRVMRIDAPVNLGNSGGGLYDVNGKLIGIVSAKRIGTNIDNMSYAIPSDLAKRLADNIICYCNGVSSTAVYKALMGITITANVKGVVVDPETGFIREAELVEVTDISAGSLADGKVMIGDIINSITLDGVTVEVSRLHHVTDMMLDARVGSKIILNVTRGENKIDIEFTVPKSSFSTVK